MAHLIESMFYVGDTPWHGLGKKLDKPPSIREALVAADMDWSVKKEPTFHNTGFGIYDETGHFVTKREDDNSILGNVGKRYEVLQNSEAFKPFDVMLDHGYTLETAGSIDCGKKVWILAKTPDEFQVGDDKILDYVLLYTSHDGTSGNCFRDVFIRVVCNNTLQASLNGRKTFEYKLRHTQSIKDRIDELVKNIHKRKGNVLEAVNHMNRFLEVDMTPAMVDAYFEAVMPYLTNRDKESIPELGIYTKNKAKPVYEKLVDLFYNGKGNNGKTLWDAYNAITEFHGQHKSHRGDWVKSTQFGKSGLEQRDAFRIASNIALQNSKIISGGSVNA